MNTKYYLPLKSVNLGHYYNKACICPVKYLKERNEDIQNIFDDFILLSTEKFIESSNCCIEIVLTEEEQRKYIERLSENYLLFKLFLPISRVAGIYFNDKEQGEKTIWNIEQGRAFMPKNKIFYDLDNSQVKFIQNTNKEFIKNNFDKNNETNLEKYNRLLGGFALMRLGGESFMNYSLNYFITLSNINTTIKRELETAIQKVSLPIKNKFEWLIFNNKSNFEELYNLTYSNVTLYDVEKFANKNNTRIDKKLGKINIESIDNQSTTYLVAILASYSDLGARLTIDNFISDLVQNKFPATKREGISFMFGINKGYESFRNIYSTEKFEAKIKFEMDTPIDYYVMESVYQFVLNNIITDRLTFLDSIMPSKSRDISNSKYRAYTILNCDIIYEKKPINIKEVVSSYLNRLFFSDFTNPLINNFEKLFGFKLTKEQSDNKNIEYENILKAPINQCIEHLRVEIESFHEENIYELKNELSKTNKERKKLSELLKNVDKDIFVRLDNDCDNLLNYEQIAEFISILQSKANNYKSNLPIVEKPKSNYIPNKQTEEIGDLFASEENNIQYENSINSTQNERKKQLSTMGITVLREEATKIGLKSASRFKNSPEDKEKLIKLILDKGLSK
ncbi:MAG: hypothetical protein A2046_09080 [Bacteroidetes bacterium GWA2_30_7]|nr:MAG: hypothetical protein A2046_09080 [Bacteroidetes bacterium GWA2_30_7]